MLVRRWLRLPLLPGLWSGRVPRWSTSSARVEAMGAVMATVGVVAAGAEAVAAFLRRRTWGSFGVLVTPRAGGFFWRAGAAPGVVVRRGWGSPKVPLGVAAGRQPGLTWLPGPGFAMAPALAVDFPRLVLEVGEFPGPGFERPGVVGLLLVGVLPLWLPAADVPGIPPAAVACPPVFGVPLPITPRYLENLLNVGSSPHLLPPGTILSR